MNWLVLQGIRKTYPGGTIALDGVDLSLGRGVFFSIVGPSNAGKSTLLKIIAGLERPDAGTVHLSGCDIGPLEPRDRRVSMLFQNIALFPTRNGFENIAFPLRVSRLQNDLVRSRVHDIASFLKVDHVLKRLPRTFSGGEQQRVAIGRALAQSADLLMLDEPLTNLDARIRIALRLQFKKLHRDTGQTILYVTHDQIEAMTMSDRIGVLNRGRFEQIGTPDQIYDRPVTEFVARFIGTPPMNILDVRIEPGDGLFHARGSGFRIGLDGFGQTRLPRDLAIGVRPEEFGASLVESSETPHRGEVLWIERLGAYQILDVKLGDDLIKVRTRPDHAICAEGPAWFGFAARSGRVLDRSTGRFIYSDFDLSQAHNSKREEASCV
jgi:ABC-type sugar transport system ATPase subunit